MTSYTSKLISSNKRETLNTATSLILFWSDLPLFCHEKSDKEPLSEFLWQGVCYPIRIKDSLPKQVSFYESTEEIVAYIVITGERYLGLDSWLETPNEDTGIEDMIFII